MSQTQIQKIKLGGNTPRELMFNPPDLAEICFEIWSWGSCQYGKIEIIYPKKVDLMMYTTRKGEYIADIQGIARIRVNNHDSRKNWHREVEIIDVSQPILVRYYGNYSCSYSYDHVFLVTKEGERIVFKRLPIKEEMVETVNGKYRIFILRTYVEYNGEKIVLKDYKLREEPIMEKLEVIVEEGPAGGIFVSGDTYHIRDTLKKLGFKWNPDVKSWYSADANVNEVAEELKKLGVKVVVR